MSEATVHLAGDLAEGEHVILQPDYDSAVFDLNTAQSELSALREELAGANRSAETLHEVIGRLKSERDTAEQRNSELLKAVEQSIEWFERISSGDGSGHADLARAIRRIAKLNPIKSMPDACTSCDGSGEYTDAIGDWRGYCSCPTGIALKNKPTESGASE